MKIFIPYKGQEIRLISDWEFQLQYHSYHNRKLWNKLGLPIPEYHYNCYYRWPFRSDDKNVLKEDSFQTFPLILEKGTVLCVNKIHSSIYKNYSDFIVFNIPRKQNKNNNLSGHKLSVILEDANNINFEFVK